MTTALPLTMADIHTAQRRLRGVAAVTPVLSSPALDAIAGRPVVCKAEALQRAGSFKFRAPTTPWPRSARRPGRVG